MPYYRQHIGLPKNIGIGLYVVIQLCMDCSKVWYSNKKKSIHKLQEYNLKKITASFPFSIHWSLLTNFFSSIHETIKNIKKNSSYKCDKHFFEA